MGFSHSSDYVTRLNQFNQYGVLGRVFPFLPFTFWCIKELGIKIFFRNFEYFIRLNIHVEKILLKYWMNKLRKIIVK